MGIPPMRTSLAYILEAACKDRGLLRSSFEALSDTEQEELVAHYLAEQQLTKWRNYADAKRMQNKPR